MHTDYAHSLVSTEMIYMHQMEHPAWQTMFLFDMQFI